MVCEKCGAVIKDEAKFCGYCGTKVNPVAAPIVEEPVVEETIVEEPIIEEAIVEEPVAEEEAVEEPVIEEPIAEVAPVAPTTEEVVVVSTPDIAEPEITEVSKKKKKEKNKKSSKKPLLIVALLVVMLAAVAFLFRDKIANLFVTSLPAEKQLQVVYKNSAQKLADASAQMIAAFKKAETKPTMSSQMEGKISVEVHQAMLTQILGVDLGDVNSVEAHYKVMQQANKMGIDLVLNLEGTKIVSANLVMDMEEGLVALLVPELSEQALQGNFDTSSYADMQMSNEQLEEVLDIIEEMLPREEFVKEFLPKYVEIVFKAIDEVKREEKTLKIGDVSQEAIVFTVVFDEDTVEKIGDAVLKELKKDKEFEKQMKKIYDAAAEYTDEEFGSWDEEYEEFLDEIEAGFESMAELEAVQDGIKFVTYANLQNEVIGVEFQECIKFLSLQKNDQVAYELCMYADQEESFKVVIEGTAKKDSFAGKVDFYAEGSHVITVNIEKLTGTEEKAELVMSVSLTAEMMTEMTGEEWALGDVTFKLSVTVTGNVINSKLELKIGTLTVMTVKTEDKVLEGTPTIQVPENVVTNPEEWIADPTQILNNLVEAGIPQELIEALLTGPQPEEL